MSGDGSSHGSKLTVSLKLLAPGNIPLLLDPKHWYNQKQGIFKGQLVPIFCAKEAGSGDLVYRCKHVIKEDEDGKALLVCSREWAHSRYFNIGSLQDHARNGPWSKTGPVASVSGLAGVKTLQSFFTPGKSKKRKTADAIADANADINTNPNVDVNVGENISVNATSNMVDTSSDMIATRDKTNSPNNITIATTNGIARDEELEARAHHVIELEYMGYIGVYYSDFSGIDYPPVFDMATSYPFSMHGKNVQQTFCKTNFIPKISWSVDSNGRFRDLHCKGVVARDKNNEEDVAATTVNGNVACDKCVGLKYNSRLQRFMERVATGEHGCLPDQICPTSTLNLRLAKL